MKIRVTTRNVFIIFDSYPRPSYPNGFGTIASTSTEGTARRLTELFRTVDLTDSFPQSLANYSGHVFVSHSVKTSTPTSSQAVLESSLAQLSTQAEVPLLRSQDESLKSKHQSSESENKEVAPNRRKKRLIRRQKQLESSSGPHEHFDQPLATPGHFSSSTRHSSRPSVSTSTLTVVLLGLILHSSAQSPSRALPPIPPSDTDRDGSVLRATSMQHESKNEDSALSAQRTEPAKSTRRLFVCGICLEEMPDESIVRPEPCGHTFCRDCLRGHVITRLNERRFPILCPTCTATKGKGKGVAGGTCRNRIVKPAIIVSHHVSLRDLAVPHRGPWTYRYAIQYLD